jgi:hypothetical protein
MPQVSFFMDLRTGAAAICTFAWDGVGHKATGPLLRLTADELRRSGAQRLNASLLRYHERDPGPPSELYQVMGESERAEFLRSHDKLSISWKKGWAAAKVYGGADGRHVATWPFPFDNESLPQRIATALAGDRPADSA